MRKIILASASPRRKKLLEQIGLKFSVVESNFPEDLEMNLAPAKLAEHLSLKKAETVAKKYKDAIIIGADTLVCFKNKIYGKPKDKKDAAYMLSLFSGTKHEIMSAFTIIDTSSNKILTSFEKAIVFFRKMTKEEIEWYVNTGEPMGKAGSYASQEKGGMFIEKIDGDFFTVVGLPLCKLVEKLKNFGIYAASA